VTTTTTPYGVIVTETETYISFRLPSWLTVDERARIKTALDEWWLTNTANSSSSPSGPHSDSPSTSGGATVDRRLAAVRPCWHWPCRGGTPGRRRSLGSRRERRRHLRKAT